MIKMCFINCNCISVINQVSVNEYVILYKQIAHDGFIQQKLWRLKEKVLQRTVDFFISGKTF